MLTRPNPLSLQTLGHLDAPELDKQMDKLHDKIVSGSSARSGWLQKQEKLLRQRKGVRKTKQFPWPGANNHSWPLTDGIIRRWKPGMVALIIGSDPVAYFLPQNVNAVKAAPIAQDYYHWRFHDMANVKLTAMELVDAIAQYGTAYTRQGWEYRTKKQVRIINVKNLFPQGVDAAVQAANQQIQAMQMQFQQALVSGQATPEDAQQIPPPTNALALVQETLEDEYVISAEDPLDHPSVVEATQAIVNGAQQVRLVYQTVIQDRPCWAALNPMDVIVPARMNDMEMAEFIAINHRLDRDQLQSMAVDGFLDPNKTAEVIEKMESKGQHEYESSSWEEYSYYSNIQRVKDTADGIDSAVAIDQDGCTNVWEIYALQDLGARIREKVVIWYHPESKTVLARFPYPYPFDEWPIVRFQFEHLSNRPYESRGVTELAAVFQATTNKMHNARLDAVQITLAPVFQMRTPAGEVNRNIKFMPGTIIPVQAVGDIQPLQMDTKPIIQLMQEENLTKGLAEQYIGIFDPSVLAQNASDRRTATEVEAVTSQTQAVFGQDASLIQDSMQKVHKQLWHLCMELDKDDLCYRVTGDEMPRLAKKSEIACDYDIVPAGTPANTSKQLAMARSREAMQIFMPDQSGLINRYELYKHYFDVLDRNLGKIVLRTPDQAAAVQMLMQSVQQLGEQQGIPPNQLPSTP